MQYTPAQLAAIERAKARLKVKEPSLLDEATGVLARTGRAAVGGTAGLMGIVVDPLTYGVNEVQEAITGKEVRNVPLRESVLQSYDKLTGGAGKPRNQLERIIQSGGEALAAGGAFAKTPAAMKTATDLVSQIGAGSAAQWAAENSDNPIAPLVAAIAGAVAPQTVKSLPSTFTKVTAKSLGVNPQRVAQLEKAGLPINVPAASDSALVKRAATQMSELPGGKALAKSMDKAFDKAEQSIRALGYKGQATPTSAGAVTSKAFNRWKAESLSKFKEADDALKSLVPDDSSVGVADDIAGGLKKIVSETGLSNRQITERLNNPAVRELSNLLDDAAKNNGTLSIGALKEAKTKIGQLRYPDPLIPTKTDALAARAYNEVSELLNKAAKEVGGDDAARLMTKRNRLYSLYMDENKNYVAKLQKKLGDTPESIYRTLTSGDKIGATKAKQTLSKLNADEMDTVRDAWISQKGRNPEGEFSIGRWAGEYSKLSKEAKEAFFGGNKAYMQAHEDLIKAVENYKDVGKFANFSGTTPAANNPLVRVAAGGGAGGAILGLLTGAISLPTLATSAAVSAGGAFAFNKAVSGMLASPKYTKLLAKSLTAKPQDAQKYQKALTRAFADFGVTEETLDSIAEEVPAAPQFTPAQMDAIQRAKQRLQQQPAPVRDDVTDRTIKQHEGLRLNSYDDTVGKRTVGYGFNMQSGISRKVWNRAGLQSDFVKVFKGQQSIEPWEAEALYRTSEQIAAEDAKRVYPGLEGMPAQRKAALMSLSYQLGLPKLKKFSTFNAAINRGDINAAVTALRNTKLATQTPNRVKEITSMLLMET